MKKGIVLCLVFMLLFPWISFADDGDLGLVPLPLQVVKKSGFFEIKNNTIISWDTNESKQTADFIQSFLSEQYHLTLHEERSSRAGSLITVSTSKKYGEEEYRLQIDHDQIKIEGGPAGVFYGMQSLFQLIVSNNASEPKVPQLDIYDKPRFKYRGLMLDVGRYFYSQQYIEKLLDLMAYYKLNVFHWHLTEDAGWRIEIKKYPLLTQVGAWRSRTQYKRNPDFFDDLPHGGFYTQEQIKEIVAYAQKRNIQIIPEIDMPGHIVAALAAYPELSCTGENFKVSDYWKIREEILCAGDENVYQFVENVLDEIIELFPSPIIHVGGDEVPKARWEKCPKCQAKMKKEGLKNEHELQLYFSERLSKYLAKKGKIMIGWDGYIKEGTIDNAMVMGWSGESGGIDAANKGHEVVMCPHTYMYLCYNQGNPSNEPYSIGSYLPLINMYNYEPVSSQVLPEFQKYIIGIEANIWTEYIHTPAELEYMGFPRILALAEIGWSSSTKKYEDFYSRMSTNLNWLDKQNVNFRIPEPLGLEGGETKGDKLTITLKPPVKSASVFYTLNNEDPLLHGSKYERPITIDFSDRDSITVKYVVKTEKGRISIIYSAKYHK